MQRGWRKAAYAWIEAQLAARGEALTKPIKLVRNWSLSCVLAAKTAVNATRYPPFGRRGIGPWRASNYYEQMRV